MGFEFVAIDGFHCGHNSKGDIYLGRAFYSKEWIPAAIIPSRQKINICYGKKQIELAGLTRIQTLIGNPIDYEWIPYNGDEQTFPSNAIPLESSENKHYFIGRKMYRSALGPGRIDKFALQIGYEGRSFLYLEDYEVLCFSQKKEADWKDLSFLTFRFP